MYQMASFAFSLHISISNQLWLAGTIKVLSTVYKGTNYYLLKLKTPQKQASH